MKVKSPSSEPFDENSARVLIANLRGEIKALLTEIRSLQEENEALRNNLAHYMESLEINATKEDQGDENIAKKEKLMLEKYMLEKYHESKTKPIRK
jgi:predicted  nucleic acid-binding Zn-ribbon protein